MKELLFIFLFCMLTVAAVFSQEKLNVYYEDDSVIFCSSDYIDTYLIAAALNKEFDNVNIRAKPWRAAKKYFLNYSDHDFVKNLDKYTGYTDNSWSNFNTKRNPQALPVVRQCVLHGQ